MRAGGLANVRSPTTRESGGESNHLHRGPGRRHHRGAELLRPALDKLEALLRLTDGAPVSGLLLGIIVAASLLGLTVAPTLVERSLFRPYWVVRRHEYETLVASGFMHADLPHLLFNAITFWAFAFKLERAMASEAFSALYIMGLLVSDAGTWLVHRQDPEYRTLGASGAIMAVLFAAICYFPKDSIYILPIPVPIPAPLFAVLYLAYTVIASRRGGGRVNHDAHLGGAVAGVAYVAIADPAAFHRATQALFG